MSERVDRIAHPWGTRTPYDPTRVERGLGPHGTGSSCGLR